MKNLLKAAFTIAALAIASQATASFVYVPWYGTNGVPVDSRTNADWPISLTDWPGWQAWRAVETNFHQVEDFQGSLEDAQTNSILTSPRYSAFTTNTVTVAPGTNFVLGWVTNFASASFTTLVGQMNLDGSTDGSNYTLTALGLVTNVPVLLRLSVPEVPAFGTPVSAVITNFTAYSLNRPDLFGTNHWLYGQRIHIQDPLSADEPTSKSYVDSAVSAVNPYQTGGMFLSGAALNMDGQWQVVSATNSYTVKYLGVDAFGVSAPGITYGYITSIGLSGNTVTVTVWTNGVTSSPAPQFTTDIGHPAWSLVDSVTNGYPTAVGTNYVLTFPKPATNSCFIRVGWGNDYPNITSVAGVFSSPMRTITNSTDSTFGHGAGMFCYDTNYIYVSTGTNTWTRAALSPW